MILWHILKSAPYSYKLYTQKIICTIFSIIFKICFLVIMNLDWSPTDVILKIDLKKKSYINNYTKNSYLLTLVTCLTPRRCNVLLFYSKLSQPAINTLCQDRKSYCASARKLETTEVLDSGKKKRWQEVRKASKARASSLWSIYEKEGVGKQYVGSYSCQEAAGVSLQGCYTQWVV